MMEPAVDRTHSRLRRSLSALLLVAVAAAGCKSANDEAVQTGIPETTSSTAAEAPTTTAGASTTGEPSSSTTTPTPSPTGTPVPLGSVDWDNLQYPIDCDTFGTLPLSIVLAEPAVGVDVAVGLVACDAGAVTPPRSIFVYTPGESPSEPRLVQTLWQDGWQTITGTVRTEGRQLTATGSTALATWRGRATRRPSSRDADPLTVRMR